MAESGWLWVAKGVPSHGPADSLAGPVCRKGIPVACVGRHRRGSGQPNPPGSKRDVPRRLLRPVMRAGQLAEARISDSASVTRARMFERIVSRPAQTALVAFEMEVSCDLS